MVLQCVAQVLTSGGIYLRYVIVSCDNSVQVNSSDTYKHNFTYSQVLKISAISENVWAY